MTLSPDAQRRIKSLALMEKRARDIARGKRNRPIPWEKIGEWVVIIVAAIFVGLFIGWMIR